MDGNERFIKENCWIMVKNSFFLERRKPHTHTQDCAFLQIDSISFQPHIVMKLFMLRIISSLAKNFCTAHVLKLCGWVFVCKYSIMICILHKNMYKDFLSNKIPNMK